jgi:hypothetical protein
MRKAYAKLIMNSFHCAGTLMPPAKQIADDVFLLAVGAFSVNYSFF